MLASTSWLVLPNFVVYQNSLECLLDSLIVSYKLQLISTEYHIKDGESSLEIINSGYFVKSG